MRCQHVKTIVTHTEPVDPSHGVICKESVDATALLTEEEIPAIVDHELSRVVYGLFGLL